MFLPAPDRRSGADRHPHKAGARNRSSTPAVLPNSTVLPSAARISSLWSSSNSDSLPLKRHPAGLAEYALLTAVCPKEIAQIAGRRNQSYRNEPGQHSKLLSAALQLHAFVVHSTCYPVGIERSQHELLFVGLNFHKTVQRSSPAFLLVGNYIEESLSADLYKLAFEI